MDLPTAGQLQCQSSFALDVHADFGMEVVAGFRGLETALNLVPYLQTPGFQAPFATMYRPARKATVTIVRTCHDRLVRLCRQGKIEGTRASRNPKSRPNLGRILSI